MLVVDRSGKILGKFCVDFSYILSETEHFLKENFDGLELSFSIKNKIFDENVLSNVPVFLKTIKTKNTSSKKRMVVSSVHRAFVDNVKLSYISNFESFIYRSNFLSEEKRELKTSIFFSPKEVIERIVFVSNKYKHFVNFSQNFTEQEKNILSLLKKEEIRFFLANFLYFDKDLNKFLVFIRDKDFFEFLMAKQEIVLGYQLDIFLSYIRFL